MILTSYPEELPWEGCSRDCSERKIVKRDLGIMMEVVRSTSLWTRWFLFYSLQDMSTDEVERHTHEEENVSFIGSCSLRSVYCLSGLLTGCVLGCMVTTMTNSNSGSDLFL